VITGASESAQGAPDGAPAPSDSAPAAPKSAAPPFDPVALGAGAVAALFTLATLGLDSRGIVGACFLGSLAMLAVIDFRTRTIPNRIVLPAAALVLALQLILFPADALEWVLASLAAAALLLTLSFARRGGIGMGDVKLGLLLGAGLGADVAVAMLIGALALWPFALWVVLQGGLDARKEALPLGPALAFGAAVVVLTRWY
jgi:leader peptidase (prepilin peptidase)/N-methyltransferase